MQKQKGFSAPVLALSVWTAALAEETIGLDEKFVCSFEGTEMPL